MQIRPLKENDMGEDVLWLKKWLFLLLDKPAPNLSSDMKFDHATGEAVRAFKARNNILPINSTADVHVYEAIWRQATSPPFMKPVAPSGGFLRFDRGLFLDHLMESLSEIEEYTVPNLLRFLEKIEADSTFQAQHIPRIAYLLSTVWHETDRTFQPVSERGCDDIKGCTPLPDNPRLYGTPHPCINLLGQILVDGVRKGGHKKTACPADPRNDPADPYNDDKQPLKTHAYYGRGYIQLTTIDHYAKASQRLFDDNLVPTATELLHFPERAMEEDLAYAIASLWFREGGLFPKGQGIDRYIPLDSGAPVPPWLRVLQYTNARKLVNNTDQASSIANRAVKLETALRLSWTNSLHYSTIQPPSPMCGQYPFEL